MRQPRLAVGKRGFIRWLGCCHVALAMCSPALGLAATV
ncbi:putative membrane protein [Synechococcus sp. WH 8103]|nr:putative membrane protein [Synechococcus sp. WH 8103]